MFKELNFESIPDYVVVDVLKRIMDYMEQEGATINDPYIKRQLVYAKLFVKED